MLSCSMTCRGSLHCAVKRANIDIMIDLLAAGANPHLVSNDGCSPSDDARWFAPPEKHDAIRKALRDYGFEEDASDKMLWKERQRLDSNEICWVRDINQDLMPMV